MKLAATAISSALIATMVAGAAITIPVQSAAAVPRTTPTVTLQSSKGIINGQNASILTVITNMSGVKVKVYRKATKHGAAQLMATGVAKAATTAAPGSPGLCIVTVPKARQSGYAFARSSAGATSATIKIKSFATTASQRGDVRPHPKPKPKPKPKPSVLTCAPISDS